MHRVPMLSLLTSILLAINSSAQDVRIRQIAETLLERANSLSTPHEFHPYEQIIMFQSISPDGVKQGRFTSVVQGPRSYRDEYQFGDYRLLFVVNGDLIADVGDRARAPLEVRRMTRLNHPYTARFDESDVIRSIREVVVDGRSSECIEFDTIIGQTTAANEICIDKELKILSRAQVNGEVITNSDFFAYRDTFLPGRIVYEQNDVRMELEQSKAELPGPFDPDFLTPPPDARLAHVCTVYRRPFGKFMPQPKPGDGKGNFDVIVHGTVRADGGIRDSSIDFSKREDLNQEAIELFKHWRFTPALCDGAAVEIPADVTLHFQNR